MKTGIIQYRQSLIYYRSWGYGHKVLFCLHGYGENGDSFSFLEQKLQEEFTAIAIDFPFHGKTQWNESLAFTVDDVLAILLLIKKDAQPLFLLGYSMGGRVALELLTKFPSKIKSVYLIAPDGLHHNFWHWLATQTFLGNKLFSYTMKNPKWFFSMMEWGYNLKWINKSIYNFTHYYLDDKNERELLYKRWTTMGKIHPKISTIKAAIRQYKIPVTLIFGKYDKIILTKNGKLLAKGLEDCITITELNAGHQLLKETYSAEIIAMFQS